MSDFINNFDFDNFENEADETNKEFIIDNAQLANWAIKKIAERRKQHDLFIEVAKKEIENLKQAIESETNKCETSCDFLTSALGKYLERDDVPVKTTKTQTSVNLPAGKIVKKLESFKIETLDHKDISKEKESESLIKTVESQYPEFIKTKKYLDWSNLKKCLQVNSDGTILDKDTGEIVDVFSTSIIPAKVEVKTN